MSSRLFSVSLLALAITACGDNKNNPIDSGTPVDASQSDASPDGSIVDASPDAPVDAGSGSGSNMGSGSATDPSGITQVIAAGSGSGLDLPITDATVTYIKPGFGSGSASTNPRTADPAGFLIQANQDGPGLFVAVDPTMLVDDASNPITLAVGDVVSFEVTSTASYHSEPRVATIGGITRSATGSDVSLLARDVSSATDLVTDVAGYDSTIVSFTGTFASDFASSSGDGTLVSTELVTAGLATPDPSLTFRLPATLVSSLGMGSACSVTATDVPVGRFNDDTEVGAYSSSDFTVTCSAFFIESVGVLSPTSVILTFNLPIDPSTVDGSDFSIAGLAVDAGSGSGRSITLTTDPQTAGTTYTIMFPGEFDDTQGSAFPAPASPVTFIGYDPADVVINEVNGNITGGCDLIELRVVGSGSIGGFRITERSGSAGSSELNYTFPLGFQVPKNAIIVLHEDGASATCNPDGATQETSSPTAQPASMYSTNYDGAYDLYMTDAGLVGTDNVITLYDPTNSIVDAVLLAGSASIASASRTAGNVVAAADQWSPGPTNGTTYGSADFFAAAVQGYGSTGGSASGMSLQRGSDTDTNTSADWTLAASSWGSANAGETAIPARAPAKVLAHRR